MTLTRTYALSPSSEGFQLYEGSNAAGILKFTSPTVSNPSTYTYTVCLSPVQHCVVMTDTNGDGWTPGSTLTVSIEGLDFGTFRLVKGYTSSGLFGDANSREIINCFFGKHQILKHYGCFRKICEKYSHPFVVYTNLLVAQGSVSAPPSSCAPTL